MTFSLSKISISPCETHHLKEGKPFYTNKFLKVLKYHEPGLAPVLDRKGAYHIDLDGKPVYSPYFKRTFGFYDNLAAVESEEGWFHILPQGTPLYTQRYAWCGNFQEGCCPVRNFQGDYFHISLEGVPLYADRYAYGGDFKDGIAVVCNEKGQNTHINKEGRFVHSQWFSQLDVFHKGFARAKDEEGWGHINKQGQFIYKNRYATVEPFYNGIAHVEDFKRRIFLIDEEGKIVRIIYEPSPVVNLRSELSNDMVGFWKTWALYTMIDLKIPDYLPANINDVAVKISVPVTKLKRLFKALWELDILKPSHTTYHDWELTDKGKCLQPVNRSFMAAAALMWGQVNKVWENLPTLIKNPHDLYSPSFKEKEENEDWLATYHQALDGYARQDFLDISLLPFWQDHKNLLGFGRCSLTLLSFLLTRYAHLKAKVIGSKKGLSNFHIPSVLDGRFQKDYEEMEDSWQSPNLFCADAIIFPRFLHYFPDAQAVNFLQRAKNSLISEGALYIIEMISDEDTPMGGLFDLNMLAETGGKVRSLKEWKTLLSLSELRLDHVERFSPVLTLLKGVLS